MMTIRREQMRGMGRVLNRPLVMPCKPDWIEIRLLDQWDEPVAGEAFEITLPDGSTVTGKLDDEGAARLERVLPGACEVRFPGLPEEDDEAASENAAG